MPGIFFSSAALDDAGPLSRTGARTRVAYAIPGILASMPYFALPFDFAATSTRAMPLPMSRYWPGAFRSLAGSIAGGEAGAVAKPAISP